MKIISINPRVLAYEKPVRFGKPCSPKVPIVMSDRWLMETTTRTQGSFYEPREVNSLNVMPLNYQFVDMKMTPSERRT